MNFKRVFCCILAAAVAAGAMACMNVNAAEDNSGDLSISTFAPIEPDGNVFLWSNETSKKIDIHTNSRSENASLCIEDSVIADSKDGSITISDGVVTINSSAFGQVEESVFNNMTVVLDDGSFDITIYKADNAAKTPYQIVVEKHTEETDYAVVSPLAEDGEMDDLFSDTINGLEAGEYKISVFRIDDSTGVGFSIISQNWICEAGDDEVCDVKFNFSSTDNTLGTDVLTTRPMYIDADNTTFVWNTKESKEIRIKTNSDSENASLFLKDKIIADSKDGGITISDGMIRIKASVLNDTNALTARNKMTISLDDGTLDITVYIGTEIPGSGYQIVFEDNDEDDNNVLLMNPDKIDNENYLISAVVDSVQPGDYMIRIFKVDEETNVSALKSIAYWTCEKENADKGITISYNTDEDTIKVDVISEDENKSDENSGVDNTDVEQSGSIGEEKESDSNPGEKRNDNLNQKSKKQNDSPSTGDNTAACAAMLTMLISAGAGLASFKKKNS